VKHIANMQNKFNSQLPKKCVERPGDILNRAMKER